jgi:hypothetical protein
VAEERRVPDAEEAEDDRQVVGEGRSREMAVDAVGTCSERTGAIKEALFDDEGSCLPPSGTTHQRGTWP